MSDFETETNSESAQIIPTQPTTSGMAIAVLILGVCGFCAGIFTSLPGIILGIISLGKIKRSNGQLKGRGLAIGGIVTASVAMVLQVAVILLAILMPALAQTRSLASRLVCGTNLSGLSKAMFVYANDYDEKFPTPENWCDLLVQYADVDERQFVCPEAKRKGRCHYAINPKATPSSPPDTVLLFETTGGWNQFGGPELLTAENHNGDGYNIVYVDGHCRFERKQGSDKLRWEP